MCNNNSIKVIRFVICLILMSYYALPFVYPISETDHKTWQPAAYTASFGYTSTPAEENNPVSHIILKKKRLILRNIDTDSFLKIYSCSSDSADLSRTSLIFAFENQLPHSVKMQAGYLGLFAGISPPAV